MFDTVLDQFNRADEQPVGGGWNALPIYNPGIPTLRVVSNQLANDAGGGTSGQYWNTQFGPDIETFATIGVKPPADNSNIGVLYARAQNVGTTSLDGYVAYFFNNGTTERFIKLYREDDGNDTLLVNQQITSGNFNIGDKVGIRVVGSVITGWDNVAGAGWVQQCTFTDTTYTGLGYCGFVWLDGTTGRVDDFGGGTVVAARNPRGFARHPKVQLVGRPRGVST
jgi:hypothetical protein